MARLARGQVLPLVNFTIKGAFWFQGENNCGECNASASCTGTESASCPNGCGSVQVAPKHFGVSSG